MRLLLIILFTIGIIIPVAYGQTDDVDDNASAESDPLTLVVPERLLIGSHKNYGLLVRDDAERSSIVTLAASSDILDLPKTIFLDSGKNHGLFPITIHGTGDVQVTAVSDGKSYTAQTAVYNQINSDYKIVLSAPNATAVSDVKIGIHLIDHFGNPVRAKADTDIRFTAINFDTVTDVITIPESESSAFVSGHVYGDAKISAYSDSTVSDSVEISRVWNTANVQLGIAPKIILNNSFAYLFIWLADEEGTQVIPHLPLSATIQTSNPDAVGFSGLYQSNHESHQKIHISDGFHMMKIYTYNSGVSTISVSVPGYGAVSEHVIVGAFCPHEKDDCPDTAVSNDEIPESADITDSMFCSTLSVEDDDVVIEDPDENSDENSDGGADADKNTKDTAQKKRSGNSSMCASVFPDSSISDAYLVWSLYDVSSYDGTLDLSSSSSNVTMYPKHSFLQDFLISSDDSVNYKKQHVFESQSRYTQSAIMPISSRDMGEHIMTITSPHYPALQVPFEITSQKQYSLKIHALPFLKSGDVEPLYTVSIVDDDSEGGAVIDPHEIFGDVTVNIITNDITLEHDSITLRDPVSVIYGIPKIKQPSVMLVSDHNIVGNHYSEIGSDLQLLIDAPDRVHAGEPFAAYGYVADSSDNTPLALSHSLSSNCATIDGILFTCDRDAEFVLIEDSVGVTHHSVEVFVNSINNDGSISVDWGDISEIILYEDHRISVNSNGAEWSVNTSIPHSIDDGIVLRPDVDGTYEVSVVFSRPGYDTFVQSQDITIHNKVSLHLRATTTDDADLATQVSIVNLDGEHTRMTPGHSQILRGENTITFPKNILTEESVGYILEHIVWNSISYNDNHLSGVMYDSAKVTGLYREVVNIGVTNALGSGVYDVGDTVTLRAPAQDVVSFLIRDVLDYWTFVPGNHDIHSDTISFAVSESFQTSAVYKQDFTGLVIVVVGASLVIIALKRRNDLLALIRLKKDTDGEGGLNV